MNPIKYLFLILILSACGGSKTTETSTEKADDQDNIRLQQYVVKGKELYNVYCVACHQNSGEGLASLYPPLAKSDYLLADLPRAACGIKNGLQTEIVVNGTKYNQMMPPNNLTPLEIAEVLTYITNTWGNEAGISSVTDVTVWLEKCGEIN